MPDAVADSPTASPTPMAKVVASILICLRAAAQHYRDVGGLDARSALVLLDLADALESSIVYESSAVS